MDTTARRNTIKRLPYRPQKRLSHAPGDQKYHVLRAVCWLVRARLLVRKTVISLLWKGRRSSWDLLYKGTPALLEDSTPKSCRLPQAPPPKFKHHLGARVSTHGFWGKHTSVQSWQGSHGQEMSLMMACQVRALMRGTPSYRGMGPVNYAAEPVPRFTGEARICATLPYWCFVATRVSTALGIQLWMAP